jgi:hypothetical protein
MEQSALRAAIDRDGMYRIWHAAPEFLAPGYQAIDQDGRVRWWRSAVHPADCLSALLASIDRDGKHRIWHAAPEFLAPGYQAIDQDGRVRWWLTDSTQGAVRKQPGPGCAGTGVAESTSVPPLPCQQPEAATRRDAEPESALEDMAAGSSSRRKSPGCRGRSRSSVSASSSVSRASSSVSRASSKGSSESAELYSELVAWAWDEAHHASAQDVALMLSCLAEVGCQSRQLTGALAVRANAEADHFTASQMAMVWRALADLGASPPGTTVDSLLHRAASISSDFKPRHAREMLHALRACGIREQHTPTTRRLFPALKLQTAKP